jgi:hypothetical protein
MYKHKKTSEQINSVYLTPIEQLFSNIMAITLSFAEKKQKRKKKSD